LIKRYCIILGLKTYKIIESNQILTENLIFWTERIPLTVTLNWVFNLTRVWKTYFPSVSLLRFDACIVNSWRSGCFVFCVTTDLYLFQESWRQSLLGVLLNTAWVEFPRPDTVNCFVHTDRDRKTKFLSLSLQYLDKPKSRESKTTDREIVSHCSSLRRVGTQQYKTPTMCQFHQCSKSNFYARRSQKRKKKVKLSVFYVSSGSLLKKAAIRMLMKLTPACGQICLTNHCVECDQVTNMGRSWPQPKLFCNILENLDLYA